VRVITSPVGVFFPLHHLSLVNPRFAKDRLDPTPGTTLELGFLGTVLHVELPHSIDAQQLTETSSFNEKYDPRSHVRLSILYLYLLG
jgi:hypothetical protein